MPCAQFIPTLIQLMRTVSAEILPIYAAQDPIAFDVKADGSPLTCADMRAHELIHACLTELTPELPVLSEECCHVPFAVRKNWQRYWLVDPIDGTKEFLKKNGEFTINIALIDQHYPVLGIVALPTTQVIYYAAQGLGAWKLIDQITTPLCAQAYDQKNPLRVVASRSHGDPAIEQVKVFYPHIELIRCGSSLKFCLLAEGLADFYPRLGPTSEWDTAAAQCIVEQAGGVVTDLQGVRLRYNTKSDYLNPYFLAAADAQIAWQECFSHAPEN
jgi:3'(2'), 5'-bisphosphate nucleotidase